MKGTEHITGAGDSVVDFSVQWRNFGGDNTGYYVSADMLADIVGPLLPVDAIAGKDVADIGSGTGRIVAMLLDAGARHVVAVEPSEGIHALRRNLADRMDRVTALQGRGDTLPGTDAFDLIFSIGVLHHVPDPGPIVDTAFRALRPGGSMVVWLYGKEGNGLYLALLAGLRVLARWSPHWLLTSSAWLLSGTASLYGGLCRYLPLPLRRYFVEQFLKLSPKQRMMTVYDQLNPSHAKYYTNAEAHALLAARGFHDVCCYHRHGYSWTVIGRKPAAPPG
ncbi:class I SAM-dependent methyltransferase [Magnetospirillum sp. UT-4]|uniref:class I SAM-dependent methyltransferase n=1 Tax=Magnetospirillum sp. UT-4 TaxID=2681467 RepID=UPI0013851D70|nr:class I SAM-dependent methyltransferase [Magnetospirillum sp. UT-4]CAA7612104.1 hypothetical protein MTBUT4_110033 [Magnetospirillum sp. UT-4]